MKIINNLRVQLRKYKRYARDLEKYINKNLENRIQIKLMKGYEIETYEFYTTKLLESRKNLKNLLKMKTINELRNNLANYKKTKKELEKLLEDKNLFNLRTILWKIRRINYKIWKTHRILKEYA